MKKVLKYIGMLQLVVIVVVICGAAYIKFALPGLPPAAQLTIERTPERVARGRYLANHVAVCMDCHSKRDWSLFAGPMLPEGQGGGGELFDQKFGFPGAFHAKNITPFALGKWTDGEILRAVTTGVSRDGKALFPIMGYLRYGKMDVEDVYSIIAYIRTLPPVPHVVPPSSADFPVNILINTMPKAAAFTKRPAESDTVAYGAYLVNMAGCVECHSQTQKGKIIAGTEFGGGMEFTSPAGIVRSPNITGDPETGIGNWSRDGFVQRFRSFADSNNRPARMGASDLNTMMPWNMYAGMRTADLAAIYTYLKSLKPIRHAVKRYEKKS